ncbi:PDR/VanB family oxidoreductase [Leucobacter sp.]
MDTKGSAAELSAHIPALGDDAIEVEVCERAVEAPGVVSLGLRSSDGRALPEWSPGSHIDVATPFGLRQYSLCGDRGGSRAGEWRIAVLDEPEGSGGSRWLHECAVRGSRLRVGAPRNAFGYRAGREALLIAGGIGITPILPMVEDLAEAGAAWRLLYTASGTGRHAFGHRLEGHDEAVLWSSGEAGRPPVRSELERIGPDCAVYCCGPEGLVADVRAIADELGIGDRVRTELFSADAEALREGDSAFTVTLQRSGVELEVPAGTTLLERLGEVGAFVVSSCRAGICGSCETPVLSGGVDHRDQVLTAEERAAGDCIFPCVSRAIPGQHLVLDV